MKKFIKGFVWCACLSLLSACESGKDVAAGKNDDGEGIISEEDSYLRGSAAEFIAKAGDRVFYAYDKSNISPEAQETLARQAAWLKANGSFRVLIEGHCDERGTREYNIGLGERRANAAARFLENQGISSQRIRTISYGKDRPIAGSGPQEEINRINRVAISVIER